MQCLWKPGKEDLIQAITIRDSYNGIFAVRQTISLYVEYSIDNWRFIAKEVVGIAAELSLQGSCYSPRPGDQPQVGGWYGRRNLMR